MKPSTKVLHQGYAPEGEYGAIMPPIYMTSTYVQEAPGTHKGYDYTRAGNPNFTYLEGLLASLENAKYATVFSSGLGAITALMNALPAGASIAAVDGLYGGTYRLFERVFRQRGFDFRYVKEDSLAEALESKPDLLFFETPTNPLLEVFDIAKICEEARRRGILTCVDNTFGTPIFQRPIELGADFVVHSCTKYMSGHSDVIGGVMVTNHAEFKEQLDFARMAIGLNPSPFDAWLVMRGVRTLAIRMERHEKNALALVEYLQRHPKTEKLYYPGLDSHPKHDVAKRQMSGFGGMVSVELDMSLQHGKEFVSKMKLFSLAESLGGVESLVCHPATMTHASIPPAKRAEMGLGDGLIRFSVGIEDSEDLIQDLDDCLARVEHLRL